MNRLSILGAWVAGGVVWGAALVGLSAIGDPMPVDAALQQAMEAETVPPTRWEQRLIESGLLDPAGDYEPAPDGRTDRPMI